MATTKAKTTTASRVETARAREAEARAALAEIQLGDQRYLRGIPQDPGGPYGAAAREAERLHGKGQGNAKATGAAGDGDAGDGIRHHASAARSVTALPPGTRPAALTTTTVTTTATPKPAPQAPARTHSPPTLAGVWDAMSEAERMNYCTEPAWFEATLLDAQARMAQLEAINDTDAPELAELRALCQAARSSDACRGGLALRYRDLAAGLRRRHPDLVETLGERATIEEVLLSAALLP